VAGQDKLRSDDWQQKDIAPPRARLRILFTEGASLSARQTLYPLGPLHDIDVIDPDPLCQCRFSNFVRRFRRSPSFAKQPEEFLEFVFRLVKNGQYDVLFPTHEQVYLLSRFRDAFAPYVSVALPEFAALERMQNKASFSRLLSELQLPQPETVICRRRRDFERPWRFPFYLKLAHSTAGGGVFFIENESTLRQQLAALGQANYFATGSEILAQQPARGILSTVQAVFNQGDLVGIHSFEARRLGVGGMSTARVGAHHPLVREHVKKLGKYLGWHGPFFIDYFYDRQSGQPEYIEANPRIGETVNAMLSGINLPELVVRIARGEPPTSATRSRVGVRTHNLLMILMSAAYDGQGRRSLLREMGRCVARRGLYENSEDELIRTHDDRRSRLTRFWVATQLMAHPRMARRIVTKTVKNYSLPEAEVSAIKRLPLNFLENSR
jgi:predicted ATP-grasp superfamily ATP-dependent carboligase